MAERSVTLEERLAALAATIEYPATPAAELRASVTAAIRLSPPQAPIPPVVRARWRSWRIRLAATLAVLLVVTGLVQPLRTAVAGFLGLRGVVIERPTTVPTPTVRPPGATPSPPGLGSGLSLGDPSSLDAARAQLAFTPLVPAALPAPDGVFVRRPPTGGALSLAYGTGPGRPPAIGGSGVAILITELRGDLAPEFFDKFVGSDATVEQVQVDGDPGYWIAGTPHAVAYHEQNGDVQIDDLRLATNTLVWQHGNLLLRIEGTQTKEQAQAIAHSMR